MPSELPVPVQSPPQPAQSPPQPTQPPPTQAPPAQVPTPPSPHDGAPEPSAGLPTVRVEAWADTIIDKLGHDPRSKYVEQFWLGILGPSTTWLIRHLADALERHPDGFQLDLRVTAGALGLGGRGGKNSPFMRSIDRAGQFGLMQRSNDTLRVRRNVPPLTQGQVNRLPPELQAAHRRYQNDELAASSDQAIRDHELKARRLALTLLEIGEDAEAATRQLARWNHSGPGAERALRWAQQRHRAAHIAALAQDRSANQSSNDAA